MSIVCSSLWFAVDREQPLGFSDDRRLRPLGVTNVKQLVDYVLGSEAAGVVDRRRMAFVIGDDPDQAVADPACLVADRQSRDRLEFDSVIAEAQPRLPACQQEGVA
jgi:hypothetical protein